MLTGRLLQVKGDILYNGKGFKDFVVERSAGYVEQTDQHYAPLTVRETFDFAAWCQGTGYRRGETAIHIPAHSSHTLACVQVICQRLQHHTQLCIL